MTAKPPAERKVLLAPQPGPQTLLLQCPVGDILFGGARGGGKTLACILDYIAGMNRYGQNWKGVWFRRSVPEIEEAQSRMLSLFPSLGATYAVQAKTWTFQNGANLKLRYLESDQDSSRYQGHEHCVAVGTPILMADRSWRTIENVRVGEMVATLEGPRKVTAVTHPYLAPCVEAVVRDAFGVCVGVQRHPVWHPVLTPRGCFPTGENVALEHLPLPTIAGHFCEPSAHSRQTSQQHRRGSSAPFEPDAGLLRDAAPAIRGWCAFSGGDQTDCRVSSRGTQEGWPPLALSVPVVLLSHPRRSIGEQDRVWSEQSRFLDKEHAMSSGSRQTTPAERTDRQRQPERRQSGAGHACQSMPNVGPCAQTLMRGAPSCTPDYRCDHGSHGEPFPVWTGSDQANTQQSGDAATPSRDWPLGATDTIPKRIHAGRGMWVHPYSGAARYLAETVEVGSCEMSPCGEVLVADITVDGANHYITRSGLINKNTWLCLDDAGTWRSSAPIDMLRATLRSPAGVPCRMVATANPGGVGHGWIKARYVDPAPPLTPFVGADGQMRVFIPSRITDNKKLLEADPTYIDRLKASGPAWLVRAWLEGDWDASQEGAIIKREWLQSTWDSLPTPDEQRRQRARCIVSVDCASSMGSNADYTAIVVALHCGHHVYLRHVRRGRWEFPALAQQVQAVCAQYAPQMVLIENKSNGQALIPFLRKQTDWKWSITPIEPKGSKAERLYAQTHWLEGGRVLLPAAADWLQAFVGELLGFDDTATAKKGQHDDQVDALSQLLAYCSGGLVLPTW